MGPCGCRQCGSISSLGLHTCSVADRRQTTLDAHRSYADKLDAYVVFGDTLSYLTTGHDPNGEVRSVELGKGTLATSKQILGSNGTVLTGLYVTTAGLYVTTMAQDASSHMLFLANGATQAVDVPMPVVGSISYMSVKTDGTVLTLRVSGIVSDQTHYRADKSKLEPIGLASETMPAAATMAVSQETATSADGTKVPLTITAPKGSVKPLPTMLQTYASYCFSGQPVYSPSAIVWEGDQLLVAATLATRR